MAIDCFYCAQGKVYRESYCETCGDFYTTSKDESHKADTHYVCETCTKVKALLPEAVYDYILQVAAHMASKAEKQLDRAMESHLRSYSHKESDYD